MKKVNPFYKTAEWKKCRILILNRDHYLCQPCLKQGKITTANTVHHIIPLEDRPDLATAETNLESICPACHNKEHPEKGGGVAIKDRKKTRITIIQSKANKEVW